MSDTDAVFNRDGSVSHSACVNKNVLMEEVKLQIIKKSRDIVQARTYH